MDDSEKVYEHTILTTVRITFRSLSPYPDTDQMMSDYDDLTDFCQLTQNDDYPRIVSTQVISDDITGFNIELVDD